MTGKIKGHIVCYVKIQYMFSSKSFVHKLPPSAGSSSHAITPCRFYRNARNLRFSADTSDFSKLQRCNIHYCLRRRCKPIQDLVVSCMPSSPCCNRLQLLLNFVIFMGTDTFSGLSLLSERVDDGHTVVTSHIRLTAFQTAYPQLSGPRAVNKVQEYIFPPVNRTTQSGDTNLIHAATTS